jgi:hypothetical protein
LALDVGEEAVVGVLQRRVLLAEHHLVVRAGEDRGRRGLTDLAAVALAMTRDQLIEALDAVDADELEQLLARVLEVLA